ncbi:hypothetical protein DSM3645_10927 [Blastopirellula marina DSM 3645]|uniref:Uncharacterized protein n=1 Tax=Blastopirellula marina DSM 3645 TaxID=314230 RepID=A3ZSS9_9BACT|nr:hypothetical protein DSM3645_10927 [Blastopirellula marina DSM 3645]
MLLDTSNRIPSLALRASVKIWKRTRELKPLREAYETSPSAGSSAMMNRENKSAPDRI